MELAAQFRGFHNLKDFSGELAIAKPNERRSTGYGYTYQAQHICKVVWEDVS